MRHNIYRLILLPAVLLICSSLMAQQFRTVTGKVEDANTGSPLQYASVHLKNSTVSTVTNIEGEFSFKVPADKLSDSLQISYLGYTNQIVSVADFNPKRVKKIKLVPSILDIRSITVRTDDAMDLFQSAFSQKSRKLNYIGEPRGMSGFYREIIKKGSKYLILTEAVVDVVKQSYTSFSPDNIAIYKGRFK